MTLMMAATIGGVPIALTGVWWRWRTDRRRREREQRHWRNAARDEGWWSNGWQFKSPPE